MPARPMFVAALAALALSAPFAAASGPDVTFCQLWGLQQFGREGDTVGLALTTTSWNIGDKDLVWMQSPSANHPFIVMNLYRLKDGRFEQIGQSWIKHGYFALGFTQCDGVCTYEAGHTTGDWLGQNCTDTYGAGLNADQPSLGPRYEVNPWTGGWSFSGSVFQQGGPANTGVARRLQVDDADLDPALNAGATYFAEGFYVHKDDVDVWNSTSFKQVTPVGAPGGVWTFLMTGENDYPNIGFALESWDADMFTEFAQQLPVVEKVSPDGRCLLGVKVTDLGDQYRRYSYTLLNIDMHRQVGSLSLELPPTATVRNAYFHAVEHHDEPLNAPAAQGGVPIDNAPWAIDIGESSITWSTTTNPLRWGTAYTFEFEINAPPVERPATLGLFKAGSPSSVTNITIGPALEPKSMIVSFSPMPPDEFSPATPIPVSVFAAPGTQQVASVVAFSRDDAGEPYSSVALTHEGSNIYTAQLAPAACGSQVEWYVEVTGDGGAVIHLPAEAPAEPLVIDIGQTSLAADDAMEQNLGWTVGAPGDDATGGFWELADPEMTVAVTNEVVQPGEDHTDDGSLCWVTGAAATASIGGNDVDDGITTLTSPVYDLSQADTATISYWRWYSNGAGQSPNTDIFEVHISSNNGASWVPLEIIGPSGAGTSGGWINAVFDAAEFIPFTSQVRLRFRVSDEFAASLIEAAIDDLRIETFACDTPACAEDLSGDGFVGSTDLNMLLFAFGAADSGDVDGDGDTDSVDLNLLLAAFGSTCGG